MKAVNIKEELTRFKNKTRSKEDELIQEAHRILSNDIFSEDKILKNLKHYNNSFEIVDEEDVDSNMIFKISEIKKIALQYRLKFIDSKYFKDEIPYEAILKIKHINLCYRKDIKGFKILAPLEAFKEDGVKKPAILFAPTNLGNYYIIHKWGGDFKWYRKMLSWPLKNFDHLFGTVIIYTLIVTLCIPTPLITLDATAGYWSGYRAAAFMHLLIFHCGVTAYITFAFGKNLSSITWNHYRDFG
ncbi:MAG: hypothetical protein Q8L81_12320 [Bacteroidota bacterium]|nr:hypothetical protein [Bacteroidota bacterium]